MEVTVPNVLITGTPGTGKTSTASMIAEKTGLKHVNVGDLIKEKSLHTGRDDEFDAFILDEDKLCDELEDMMAEGGQLIDFHSCDFFPERWFHLVLVLTCNNTVLFDRLTKRGYEQNKVTENVECEIMQVVLQEAREAYAEEIVQELQSNTVEEMETNVGRVEAWLQNWKQNNPNGITS
jgi:adenylate kinase